jgi:hypothetical protein
MENAACAAIGKQVVVCQDVATAHMGEMGEVQKEEQVAEDSIRDGPMRWRGTMLEVWTRAGVLQISSTLRLHFWDIFLQLHRSAIINYNSDGRVGCSCLYVAEQSNRSAWRL